MATRPLVRILPEGYKVAANIPYYITSAVIRHLLESKVRPSRIVLTVQREVAERMVAQPDDMNLLAVSVQFYSQPSLVARVPAGAFYPRPDVDSQIVRLDVREQPAVPVANVEQLAPGRNPDPGRVGGSGAGGQRGWQPHGLTRRRPAISLPSRAAESILQRMSRPAYLDS